MNIFEMLLFLIYIELVLLMIACTIYEGELK